MIQHTKRLLRRLLAVIGLVLAVIGAVLPVMPTVPFLLFVSLGCGQGLAAPGSLVAGSYNLGATYCHWRQHGAVSRKAKGAGLFHDGVQRGRDLVPARAAVVALGCGRHLFVVGAWLASRPEPRGVMLDQW